MKLNCWFTGLAQRVSWQMGRPLTFFCAVFIVIVWALTGPMFNYSDTWQLVINTGTTIITFLMVFLIQNTQNRDSIAMQLKLDELLRAIKTARNSVIDLESLDENELQELLDEYRKLARNEEPVRSGKLKNVAEAAAASEPPEGMAAHEQPECVSQ